MNRHVLVVTDSQKEFITTLLQLIDIDPDIPTEDEEVQSIIDKLEAICGVTEDDDEDTKERKVQGFCAHIRQAFK